MYSVEEEEDASASEVGVSCLSDCIASISGYVMDDDTASSLSSSSSSCAPVLAAAVDDDDDVVEGSPLTLVAAEK